MDPIKQPPSSPGHDVFLSYARKDQAKAKKIATALEGRGLQVWWDPHIIPGDGFVNAIEQAMNQAACIVVLWSSHSINSRYVRNEAEYGANQGKLVPVMLEDVELPWETSNFQALDLSGWDGKADDEEFGKLVESLRLRVAAWDPARAVGEKGFQHLSPKRTRFRPIWALAALALVAAMVFGGVALRTLLLTGGDAPDLEEYQYSIPTSLTDDGMTLGADISPDGQYLAYVHREKGAFSLHVKQLNTGTSRILVPDTLHSIRTPVFSPDGSMIFFTWSPDGNRLEHKHDLFRVAFLGGEPRKLVEDIVGRRIDCSPAGDRLAFMKVRGDSLLVQTSRLDGSYSQTHATIWAKAGMHANLAWSRDGQSLFSLMPDSVTSQRKIIEIPVDGSPIRDFGDQPWQAVLDIRHLPGSNGLLVVGLPFSQRDYLNLNLWLAHPDLPAPHALTRGADRLFQISPNAAGDLLVYSCYNGTRRILVQDLDRPDDYVEVASNRISKGQVEWSADGRLLATQTVGKQIGIVRMTSRGGGHKPIIAEDSYISQLDQTEDGAHLAYTMYFGDRSQIYLSEGLGHSPRPLTPESGSSQYPSFDPSGRFLYFVWKKAGQLHYHLHRHDLEDGSMRQILDQAILNPMVSPDGMAIVASALDETDGSYKYLFLPLDGGNPRTLDLKLRGKVMGWYPDSQDLVCTARSGRTMQLWRHPLNEEEPTQLTFFRPGHRDITSVAWNAAGDSLAVIVEDINMDAYLLEAKAP
jgi:Tol biopolymer transport system component